MGNAAPRAQPASQLDSGSQYRTYLMDYAPNSMNIVFGSLIGDGKFLKSIYCKCEEGSLVVKIYRKYDPNESLSNAEVALRRLFLAFSTESQPNLIPYVDYQLSSKYNVAFIVRQYFAANLYDRVCSRPFLTKMEKKWIAYQILRALDQCHSKGICHGDIKQENIMVTSWNWIFLTDFAPFKPTYIPEDDPADYNYYFSAINATRRSCTVAPERFYCTSSGTGTAKVGTTNTNLSASAVATGQSMLSKLADSEISLEEVDKSTSNGTSTSIGIGIGTGTATATGTSGSDSNHTTTTGTSGQNMPKRDGPLLESMDIFSAGCIIAELFLGGKPLFDLPTLLKYRTLTNPSESELFLKNLLKKIDDSQMEEMILHMLQLDPRRREKAKFYLQWTSSCNGSSGSSTPVFPLFFDTFLFRFLNLVLSKNGKIPDARIRLVCKYYGRILKEIVHEQMVDEEGEFFFQQRLKEGYGSERNLYIENVPQRVLEEMEQQATELQQGSNIQTPNIQTPNTSNSSNTSSTHKFSTGSTCSQKKKIEKLHEQYNAFVKKKKEIKKDPQKKTTTSSTNTTTGTTRPTSSFSSKEKQPVAKGLPPFGLILSAPLRQNALLGIKKEGEGNGLMIILSLICSSVRHVQVPQSKLTAIHLITRLGQFTDDETRLQRLVPFCMELLEDSNANVKALAIQSITLLLAQVRSFPLSDASIFPQYILPSMMAFPQDPEEIVRISFAACLPLLAETSRRFLELAHAMKQRSLLSNSAQPGPGQVILSPATTSSTNTSTGGDVLGSISFDKELGRLHKVMARLVIQIAAPDQKASSSLVKRALLLDLSRLCVFFGRERTLDVVLPQLIAFLNDRDWHLRASFFDCIAGMGPFVGRTTVELYILPCIEQALIDVQEQVIQKALHSLRVLCEMGLFGLTSSTLVDKIKSICPLVLHPSWWIRDAVIKLMWTIAKIMGQVDANVFLLPLLRPFLVKKFFFTIGVNTAPVSTDEVIDREQVDRLVHALRPHISREAFDAALVSNGNGPNSDSGTRSRKRDHLNSTDSLGTYSMTGRPPAVSSSSTPVTTSNDPDKEEEVSTKGGRQDQEEEEEDQLREKRKMEAQGLALMKNYVEMASLHMKSKMELAHSEQVARMQQQQQRSSSGTSLSNASRRSMMMEDSIYGIQQRPPRSSTSSLRSSGGTVHILRVPDMRFALAIATPLKSSNVILSSGAAKTAVSNSTILSNGTMLTTSSSSSTPSSIRSGASSDSGQAWENLSLSLISKMYGLSTPVVLGSSGGSVVGTGSGASSGWNSYPFQAEEANALMATARLGSSTMNPGGSSTFYDSSHFASAYSANSMIYNVYTRDMYADGGGFLDQSHPLSPSSKQRMLKKSMTLHHHAMYSLPKDTFGYDPALFHPRKLLSRLSSLGIPPLPPDLGALRGSDGAPYSIYALSSSPYSQYLIQDGSGSSGGNNNAAGSNSLGGTSASTAMATAAAVASSGMLPSPSGGASGSFGTGGSGATGGPGGSASMGGSMSMSSSYYRNWRPRKNILVAELGEHAGSVNRIGAAQDFSFLASASNDGTVKLWSIRSLQHSINQGSRCTYDGQGGVLTDMVVLDNSHSVASASSNGSVHVFRVERVSTSGGNFHAKGLKELRTEENDAIMVLDHFNTISESLLVYATRNGFIHGWDLRMRREAWRLHVSPELGYVTCMTHSLDVSWFAAGTSRGFILLWDLRFLVLIRIWRHSSHRTIHRLLPCLGLPNTHALENSCVPLVYVAAGDGEVAAFDLSIGACRAVFRTLHVQSPESEAGKCPTLLHVPIPHRQKNVLGQFLNMSGVAAAFDEIATTPLSEEPNVRAILCPSLHMRGLGDAVITGGEDKQIRYWDIRNGKQSFTVSGNAEAKSFYDNQTAPHDWWCIGGGGSGGTFSTTVSEPGNRCGNEAINSAATPTSDISKPELAWSKLSPPIINICQDASYLATQGGLGAAGASVQSAIAMERRGLVPPSPAHNDCILDLTLVDLNGPMLVSSGRDGMIKVWK